MATTPQQQRARDQRLAQERAERRENAAQHAETLRREAAEAAAALRDYVESPSPETTRTTSALPSDPVAAAIALADLESGHTRDGGRAVQVIEHDRSEPPSTAADVAHARWAAAARANAEAVESQRSAARERMRTRALSADADMIGYVRYIAIENGQLDRARQREQPLIISVGPQGLRLTAADQSAIAGALRAVIRASGYPLASTSEPAGFRVQIHAQEATRTVRGKRYHDPYAGSVTATWSAPDPLRAAARAAAAAQGGPDMVLHELAGRLAALHGMRLADIWNAVDRVRRLTGLDTRRALRVTTRLSGELLERMAREHGERAMLLRSFVELEPGEQAAAQARVSDYEDAREAALLAYSATKWHRVDEEFVRGLHDQDCELWRAHAPTQP